MPENFKQDLIPKEISKIIGLKKAQPILFFAGGAGDWAACLAKEGCKVHYTDISRYS